MRHFSLVAYKFVRLCEIQCNYPRKTEPTLFEGPIMILRKLASGCSFKTWFLGYATDFHKIWVDPCILRIETLLKIWSLICDIPPQMQRKKYFSTAQNFPQKFPNSREKFRMRVLMHLLDSYADIFALSLLSALKSCSHISEEYYSTIVIYCVFKLLLWGDFNNSKKILLFCLFLVQQSNREQRSIFLVI